MSGSLLLGLTYVRILLIPFVMGFILLGPSRSSAYVVAAVLFALAAATDFIDGYLARRWALTTTFGSFLDTTADKLLVSGVLLALVAVDRVSPWIAFVIVGRELLDVCRGALVETVRRVRVAADAREDLLVRLCRCHGLPVRALVDPDREDASYARATRRRHQLVGVGLAHPQVGVRVDHLSALELGEQRWDAVDSLPPAARPEESAAGIWNNTAVAALRFPLS